MQSNIPMLWVTSGVHLTPENPKSALINGFVRTLRNEMVTANISLLDLSSKSSKEIAAQISSLVKSIMAKPVEDSTGKITRKALPDWEFCEYQGLRYVPRVILDKETSAKYTLQGDHKTQMEPYRQSQKDLGLVCSRRGMLSSLVFEDRELTGLNLPTDHVELCPDVFGLSPEDVATALDITPFAKLGIACSGIIKRVGSTVEDFAIGDRIFTLAPNEFRNRLSIPAAACSKIPADIDPIDFTGSLIAYATAVRALLHVAGLEKGEKILIHRAAGGVGIAAIKLCKHIGAEIFATCQSVEERSFLTETHNISPDNIFPSDDLSLRERIMAAAGGEGVDVILNSLAGDMLHESWKCLAPCGRFIDIGKRDMLLSGRLNMSGFVRNNIYAAVDLAGILTNGNKILRRLLKDVIQLYNDGAIDPIDPITRFPITEVEEAFSYMSTGIHIGSIVLTVDPDPNVEQMVKVLQKPHEVQFNPEATYLLIGGLGGIGCSLAVWMAEKGAKHLTFMARSGVRTEEAKKALRDIQSLGCEADLLQCDVGDFEAVNTAMASITRPLHGIIHAAMALKDGVFENMEHGDFVLPLRSKVQGLLNLEKILDQPHYPDLDFFVVLSSISGVLGTPGQSNYAAASTFEDAFVRTRQRKGNTACALDLGMINNIGYISRNPHLERKLIQQAGIGSYNERQVQSLFRIALDTPLIEPVSISSQLGDFGKAQLVTGVDIQPMDIRRVQETNWFRDPKWRIIDSIVSSRMSASDGYSMDQDMFNDEKALNARFLDLLKGVEARQAEDVVSDIAQCIIWKAAVMTMVPAAEILPEHSLIRYGMDSLAAVEIRNWFLRVTEVEMKVEDVLTAVSIRSLAEKVYNGYRAKNEKGNE